MWMSACEKLNFESKLDWNFSHSNCYREIRLMIQFYHNPIDNQWYQDQDFNIFQDISNLDSYFHHFFHPWKFRPISWKHCPVLIILKNFRILDSFLQFVSCDNLCAKFWQFLATLIYFRYFFLQILIHFLAFAMFLRTLRSLVDFSICQMIIRIIHGIFLCLKMLTKNSWIERDSKSIRRFHVLGHFC